MKSYTLIGSEFEVSLRILLLLSQVPTQKLNDLEITTYDFISIYSADFLNSTQNLHGSHLYRFSEFPFKISQTKKVLRQLVIDKVIDVTFSSDGYLYSINDLGIDKALKFSTSYAMEYLENVQLAFKNPKLDIHYIYEVIKKLALHERSEMDG